MHTKDELHRASFIHTDGRLEFLRIQVKEVSSIGVSDSSETAQTEVKDTHLQLQYCVSFPDGENMMSAMSISQSTDNSYAFLMRPFRRFEYVTCLLVGFSIFLISNLTLPIFASLCCPSSLPRLNHRTPPYAAPARDRTHYWEDLTAKRQTNAATAEAEAADGIGTATAHLRPRSPAPLMANSAQASAKIVAGSGERDEARESTTWGGSGAEGGGDPRGGSGGRDKEVSDE